MPDAFCVARGSPFPCARAPASNSPRVSGLDVEKACRPDKSTASTTYTPFQLDTVLPEPASGGEHEAGLAAGHTTSPGPGFPAGRLRGIRAAAGSGRPNLRAPGTVPLLLVAVQKASCASLTAPLLPCAFPAAEEEAEAGLGAESRSCDELFAEEAVLPSATGTEEEHEA